MSNTTRRSVLGTVLAAFFARLFPRSVKAAPPQTSPDTGYTFLCPARPVHDTPFCAGQRTTYTYDVSGRLRSVETPEVFYDYCDYPVRPASVVEINSAAQPCQSRIEESPDENGTNYSIRT